MKFTSLFAVDDPALNYAVTHVFFPVEVPKESDYTIQNDLSLARAVCAAAHAYSAHIDDTLRPQWLLIVKMLDNLRASIQPGHLVKGNVISQLGNMQSGDILAYLIRTQHAAVIFRKQENHTLYESLEVSAWRDAVLNTGGRLVCSYVGKAIGVPNEVFGDLRFQSELTNFLSLPGKVNPDPPNVPAAHPEYITALLTGILRGVGHIVEGSHILKHVRDEVGESEKEEDEWRRSSLWLLIRVAIQSSLDRSSLGQASYKAFMLFFICNLAKDANNAGLCSNLLHLISCKILRRLSKLGTSAPDWLSDMALKTSTCLQDTLEVRAKEIQASKPPLPYWNPSELDLANDTRLSLPHSGEYIRSALANPGHNSPVAPFPPKVYYRGTLEDFLSSSKSLFDKAYAADPYVALYDVERSVEQGIDQWVARVTNTEEACTQLGTLMDIYLSGASIPYADNPEYRSIMTLTALELWVALDKLAVKDIPMIAEYSPEIPRSLLESLLLREATSLQRLSCVYQYLSARYSGSRAGLSVLSDEFSDDSFAVRYCDSSPAVQNLKARIEAGTATAEDGELPEGPAAHLALTFCSYRARQYSTRGHMDEDVVAAKSLVPILPLHCKVIAFELQCPAPFRIWRSAVAHLLYRFDRTRIQPFEIGSGTKPHDLLSDIPELQPYLAEHLHENSSPHSQFYVAFFHPDSVESRIGPRLRHGFKWLPFCDERTRWWGIGDGPLSQNTTYYNFFDDVCIHLALYYNKGKGFKFARYIGNTIHSTNAVLSAQADCPAEFSIDEFVALGHLRSGSSLQWVNILRELRSRTLNFRSHEVYFLLAQATSQVGQLDVNTGDWVWNQELQNASFCNGLLDEIGSLFLDISTGSLDEVAMRTISLLLTRVLASSPSGGVSERAFQLLRGVRWKTLEWVQELAYNLMQAPTNGERRQHLYNMAAACQSTFDVSTSSLRKVLHSAEDVEAFLSCTFFMQATSWVLNPVECGDLNCPSGHFSSSSLCEYSELLHQRDRRLSVAAEAILRDAIQADVTDRGIDLAVRNIWPGYQAGPRRWEPEQYPNSHWLVCTTAATADRRSQVVHINLLDGSLLVDGRPLGGLPRTIREHPLYRSIFCDETPLVIPSDLPGMDFVTLSTISNHFVRFSLRGDDLVIRAQQDGTNDVLELVPPEKLKGDIPTFLIEEHVHWLNLSTSVIEIRPHKNVWEKAPDIWRISCEHGRYHAYKDGESLVDVQSQTWAMTSSLLECLDLPEYIVVTTSVVDSSPTPRLSIALPYHGLSFFVNANGDLESNDFREMVYDEDQGIGTLFGLVNRLVLRAKGEVERGVVARCVLVPHDPFKILGERGHRITYHLYKVDTELGCLAGNAGQDSKGFLAYLHAKTSIDWLPDPLTGRTGAHEALSILASAGLQSFNRGSILFGYLKDISSWHPRILLADEQFRPAYNWTRTQANWLNTPYQFKEKILRLMRGSGRADYLFPNITAPTLPRDYENTNYVSSLLDLELEDVAYTAAFVVHHQPVDALTTNTISNWTELWGDTMSEVTTHSPSVYDGTLWNPNLPQAVSIKVHDILRKRNDDDSQQFQQLLLLPTLAYCSSHPQTAFLSMLLAFANEGQCGLVSPVDYKLLDGYCPTEQVLRYHIGASRHKDRTWDEDSAQHSVDAAVECLLGTWPSDTAPSLPLDPDLWDIASLSPILQALFSSCYRNLKLKEHLTCVLREFHPVPSPRAVPLLQSAVGQLSDTSLRKLWTTSTLTLSARYHHKFSPPAVRAPLSSPQHTPKHLLWRVTLDQLLSERDAPVLPNLTKLTPYNPDGDGRAPLDTPAFDRLFPFFRENESDPPFQAEYITELHASARRVREEYENSCRTMWRFPKEDLKKHFVQCSDKGKKALLILKESLGSIGNSLEQALIRGGQWPQITADSLLRCLASTSPIKLSQDWKHCLVSFGLLLLECQRARRLLQFAAEGLEEEFSRELQNEGCDGWDAEQYPDWLLIQLQGNFLIRRQQVDIAMEMISPQSGENTVMQVSMGEGKSSVIIPITAAALADGHQLVRVIVPNALTNQMYDLLVDRLGGLTNRPIYRLSFSRSDHERRKAEDLCQEMSQCMDRRGILLVQPEDILSLKLTSVEKQMPECKLVPQLSESRLLKLIYDYEVTALSLNFLKDSYLSNLFRGISGTLNYSTTRQYTDNTAQGDEDEFKLLALQKWLHSHSRDILDESDEILNARRQLIYTVGYPQHIDGYPDRWTVIQQVLRLVKKHASSLSMNLPESVEYRPGPQPGSFPHFRILRTSRAGRQLISLLVRDIMAGHLPAFRFRFLNEIQRDAISDFISSEELKFDVAGEVKEYASRSQQSNLWSGLLLLRGLFASGILLFALTERRWRVDYGHPQYHFGTMLAIPYRAKDVPAHNTQFGHPDITFLLTCLSYYYGGLSEEQLRISFQTFLNHDNPAAEYALWVQDCGSTSLPSSVQSLKEFNLESSEQWDNCLFPIFAYNQAAIDFYLSHVVFPKEAKEYPWKLTGSSWDLAEKRERLITGFSGTNDARYLLPATITQHGLDHQEGANARVLAHLLRYENDSYMMFGHESGQPLKTLDLLKIVVAQKPEIRVLLDVGAQILDVSNKDLAKEWLDLTSTAGAVYFDFNDELMVLTRHGTIQPLTSSSLAQQLDRCVVYLDHAHTRGTDLKLPKGFRAAVTLGPKVTKDRLVQGCMRMRKLGNGHSVMFFAPLEVDQSIRSVTHKEDRSIRIATADVLKWAIHETWTDIKQQAPHWAQQGMSHRTRFDAWSRFCNNEITPDQLTDAWVQPETKSLADLYAPCEDQSASGSTSSELDKDIGGRCDRLGVSKPSVRAAQLDEQLERQVNREIEREREVELPPKAEPAEHSLHRDVVTFVRTGTIRKSNAFRPVFTSLERSSAAIKEAHVGWSPFILATADFCETIKQIPSNGSIDQYLRPVQWVLSGKKDDNRVLVVLSPFEADQLMPDIKTSKYVHLHVYIPRTSVRMKPADDLMFYAIPPLPDNWTPPLDLIDQLNVFAGQLYLRDWDAYHRLSRFLDVQKQSREDKRRRAARYNLFDLDSRKELERAHPDSLLPSVMMLLAIRRRGLPFAETHMGKILQGRSLTEEDFASPAPASAPPSHGQMQLSIWSENTS